MTKEELEQIIDKTEEVRRRVTGDMRYLAGIQVPLKAKRETITWQIDANEREIAKLKGEEATLIDQLNAYKAMLGDFDDPRV